MQLLLNPQTIRQLEQELRRAGRREIGGLLMGEHVRDQTFRVVEVSVQRSGGSAAHFVRDPAQNQAQLDEFFSRTGADYTRFNYLGEWHSHPSFEPLPSGTDIETMQSIVEDPAVGVNFLVLLILTLTRWRRIKLSAMLFRPDTEPAFVSIAVEGESGIIAESTAAWLIRKIFRR